MSTCRAPETFNPCIFTTVHDGEPFWILVCGNSLRHTGGRKSETDSLLVDQLCHPVAIRLGSPAHVLYGFKDNSHSWLLRPIEQIGMTKDSAQRALAEAWRGVEEITQPTFPEKKLHFHYKVNRLTSLDECEKPQEKTMFRNVTLWIQWDCWNAEKLTNRQRAEKLKAMGIPATEKQIEKIIENASF